MGVSKLCSLICIDPAEVELRFLNTLQMGMWIFSLFVVIMLQFMPAFYGRFTSVAGWMQGPHIHGKFAWIIQEVPNVVFAILFLFICYQPKQSKSLTNCILLSLFLIHYLQRTFIFPLLIRGGKPTPCSVVFYAFLFCTVNGYMQLCYLMRHAEYPEGYLTSPQCMIGFILFFAGMAINLHSDHILRSLRKPGDKTYHIPRGGLFEHVSCPNYLGEMIEWAGFVICCGSGPALVFAVATISNLAPRAAQTHRWYLEKFKEYPRSRKRLIPLLW